jgi:endonuclease III
MGTLHSRNYIYQTPATVLRLHPIGEMLKTIRAAIAEFPKATLFEMRDRGYDSLFEQICACIISVRTFDEVSLPAALRLFENARTAAEMNQLSENDLYELIRPASFGREKARALKAIAKIAVEEFDGEIPGDYQTLTDLPGLGPKAANLVLGIACQVPALGVDVHVHRITNRWGYLNTPNAEHSLLALARKLPKKYWVEMNELLVPFGKNICTGKRPKCSVCPVFQYCERRGVKNSI